MTGIDYETATLAARHAGLWIAGAHVFVGLLQAAVVAFGIRAMVRANDERAAAAAAARREADQRHAENMTALKAIIEGQQAQTRALETLIERTAPRADR